MVATVEGIIVTPEVTDGNPDRDIKPEGLLHFLVTERGRPMCRAIKCSIKKANEFLKAGIGISEGNPVQGTSLVIDISEYDINGRRGTSYKLVEA